MTTWIYETVNQTTAEVDVSVELANGVSAGAVLCAIEAGVVVSHVPETFTGANPALINSWGLGIAAVDHGAGGPDYVDSVTDDIWLFRQQVGLSDNQVFWGYTPSPVEGSADAIVLNGFSWICKWRGARYYSASMDWWIAGRREGPTDVSQTCVGAVRLGFWD